MSDARGRGFAPVHAVWLLSELRADAAIEPMLAVLAETEWETRLHDAIVMALPKMGVAVLEPALRSYAEHDLGDARESLASILAALDVRDDRILAILREQLALDPQLGASDLARYGDPRALDDLVRAFDAYHVFDTDHPFGHQALIDIVDAIEELGGTLTPAQARTYARAMEPYERWRRRRAAERAVSTTKPTKTDSPGRNEPCWCGSSKKFTKCHLDEDRAESRGGESVLPIDPCVAASSPGGACRVLPRESRSRPARRGRRWSTDSLAGCDVECLRTPARSAMPVGAAGLHESRARRGLPGPLRRRAIVRRTNRWRLDARRVPPGGTDSVSRAAVGDRASHACERFVPVDQLDRAVADLARTLTELARPRRLPLVRGERLLSRVRLETTQKLTDQLPALVVGELQCLFENGLERRHGATIASFPRTAATLTPCAPTSSPRTRMVLHLTARVGRQPVRRGELRWYTFAAPDKRRRVLLLTRSSVIDTLNEIIVAPATRTIRGLATEALLSRAELSEFVDLRRRTIGVPC